MVFYLKKLAILDELSFATKKRANFPKCLCTRVFVHASWPRLCLCTCRGGAPSHPGAPPRRDAGREDLLGEADTTRSSGRATGGRSVCGTCAL